MEKEKQIEEMAKIIGDNTEQDTMWSEIYDCANALYNAGYRKTSEVARVIFALIYDRLLTSFPEQSFVDAPCITYSKMFDMLDELQKKYTEDGK